MKILTLAFLLLSVSAIARPGKDTTAYWHVALNGKVIAKYNDGMLALPILKLVKKRLAPTDSLVVTFGSDTPCRDCLVSLYMLDDRRYRATLATTQGTGEPLKVSLRNILNFVAAHGSKELSVYHNDGKRERLLFQVKLL